MKTWNELKEFIETLTDEQKARKVNVLIGDDSMGKDIDIFLTEEDIYQNVEDDEDCGPLKELMDVHGEDFNESDYPLITKKGTPFIYIE